MVKIYTVSYNRPEFIRLQHQQFKAFLKDEYCFIILNNAKDLLERNRISQICEDLGLECILIDNTNYRPDAAGLPALEHCIKKYISHESADNLSVIIDSDVFIYKEFSFKEVVDNYDLCTIYQQRVQTKFKIAKKNVSYFWIAFLVLNHAKRDFSSLSLDAIIGLTDLGGASYHFLNEQNPHVKWMEHTPDLEKEGKLVFNEQIVGEYDPEFGFQLISDSFIHYYRGSNWDGKSEDYHERKIAFLLKVLAAGKASINYEALKDHSSSFAHTFTHFDGIRYKNIPWYYKLMVSKTIKVTQNRYK